MGLLSTILKHNPIDRYAVWNRKRLTKKGKCFERDCEIYNNIGMRWFPKILKFTNDLSHEGTHNIFKLPNKGGFIVVANHRYTLDPFYIGTAFHHQGKYSRKIHWVSKYENFKYPIQRSIIIPFGTIPLTEDRKLSNGTLKMIEGRLENGIGVGMFPEGHRNKDGTLAPFHAGAARLCLEHNVPYIPVAITGKSVFFKGKCHVSIGEPVYLDPDLSCEYDIAQEIADDMHDQVNSLLNKTKMPVCRYSIKAKTVDTTQLSVEKKAIVRSKI